MIALCVEHHAQADGGAFTIEQLRSFKGSADLAAEVKGRFNWMRNDLLLVLGGCYYLETYEILRYKGDRVIWLSRDEEGYLLLNVAESTVDGEPRFSMEENFWTTHGKEIDIECPPSGKKLSVKYANGDSCSVEFLELASEEALRKRYADAPADLFSIKTPITAVEVTFRLKTVGVDFGPKKTILGGNSLSLFVKNCGVGIDIR
ncbi:hypothetical protein CGU37_22415 [Pseudomonas fluorescens]|nr:hypothetical protein CGU36_23455 [Pseudomonas fluorescens]OZO46853.1 hypothetical protein CGU37_22415 [Pseudomonas fluorescens]